MSRASAPQEENQREQEERQHGGVVGDVDGAATAHGETEAEDEARDRENARRDGDVPRISRPAQERYGPADERRSDNRFRNTCGGGTKRLRATAKNTAEVERRDHGERRRLEDQQSAILASRSVRFS
jgi:hypothetical protein